jgi:hypothetical protein
MKGMIFKKALLLSGIFLLSTFILAQLSWGCDDDDKDKWDCDHHDNWDCLKHGKPCQPPKIQKVFLDYNPDSETFIRFSIWGKNFDNGAPPVVALGGEFGLTVMEHSDGYIVATLPKSEEQDFDYGDYRLVVSTCHDSACKEKYCKDHGPNCKCKYCKEHCSKCKDRYCKNKYCKDHEYECKCKDRYSLTIADPSGPQGTIESVMIQSDGVLDDITFPKKIEGYAYCDAANGYTVTGGGFEASKSVSVIESVPVYDQKGKGWYVKGAVTGSVSEIPATLKIYAVCAKIK